MGIKCLLCGTVLASEYPYLLKRHFDQVHIDDERRMFTCPLPGCEGSPPVPLTPHQICEHQCAHYRFLRSPSDLYEEERQERELEGQAGEEESEEPLLQFDPWLLDSAGDGLVLRLVPILTNLFHLSFLFGRLGLI